MKTTKRNLAKAVTQLAAALLILLTASCSQDGVLDENLDSANAKSQKADLKILAKGAAIHGTNGIYFGPDDNLYIASFYGQEIVVMNKQNGKILRKFGVADNVLGPDDLVFHPDGKSFYFTDILTGEVGRMDLEGNLIKKQFIAAGVNPITFKEDEGRLFVGFDFGADGLFELDPELNDDPRVIVEYASDPSRIGYLNAFDFGPDGFLYGPVFTRGTVVKVDVDASSSSNPYDDGVIEIIAEGFTYPVAAKFGPDGLLTVLDQSGEIFKVNHETGNKTLFTTLDPGLDNLAFDSEGNLYVSNADFGWIIQILPSGQARTISQGGMIGPQGVAVLPGANNKDAVFVGDVFRMRQFNGLTGKEENVYKGYLVAEPGKLTMPFSVQADGENLIVSNWFDGLVQSWSPENDAVANNEEYQLIYPIDAVRVNGDIVVSDLGLGLVKASDPYNPILTASPIIVASGLATNGTALWAADWLTGNIYEIDVAGGIALDPPVATGLRQPEGIALDGNGGLLVVETGTSRLLRVDIGTGDVTMVAENLELSSPSLPESIPTWWFDGVAVGPSGDIYISGGGKNVIYKIPNNKLR